MITDGQAVGFYFEVEIREKPKMRDTQGILALRIWFSVILCAKTSSAEF
jgi:hypothetical protein